MLKLAEKFEKIENFLNNRFFERMEEIHGISLAILSKTNTLFLGSPGTAKSDIVNTYAQLIEGSNYFQWLMSGTTTPAELFGNYSISQLKQDNFVRVTDGKLPKAHIAFLDEIFKGNSTNINTLLSISNERIFHNGTTVEKVPLFTLIGASNEMPEAEDHLEAMFDRFALKYEVKPIKERYNLISMLKLEDLSNVTPFITLDEIHQAQEFVKNIQFTDESFMKYVQIIEDLHKEGFYLTDRKKRISIKIIKAEAFLNGRDHIENEDIEPVKNCFWSDLQTKPKIISAVIKAVSPIKEKILEIIQASEEATAKGLEEYYAIRKKKDSKDKAKNNKTLQDAYSTIVEVVKDLKIKHDRLNDYKRELKATKLNTKIVDDALARSSELIVSLTKEIANYLDE